jgi:pSer/pThr/pTyr-binding forkhead associated (FHA) protein
MYLIVVTDEKGALVCETALEHQLSIGRTTENQIILPSSAVSRKHAIIYLENQRVMIEDQGSANGVFVDDEPIAKATQLYEGSQARIGSYRLYLEKQEMISSERNGYHTAVVHPHHAHAKLIITGGAFAGKEFHLFEPLSRVGRTNENEITIQHPSISRDHAQIKRQDNGSYILIDLGSSNGTIVRGKKVKNAVPIWYGDHLQFGQIECMLVDLKGQSTKRNTNWLQITLILIAIVLCAILGGVLARNH